MNRTALGRVFLPALGSLSLLLTMGMVGPSEAAPAGHAPVEDDCAGGGTAAARVVPGSGRKEPGTLTASEARAAERDLEARVEALVRDGTLREDGTLPPGASTVKVQTHVHVLTSTSGVGSVTMDQVRQQMRVLNQSFAGTPAGDSVRTKFSFKLASLEQVPNDAWYPLRNDYAMMAALRRGSRDDLNIYISDLGGGLLGYASLPSTHDIIRDGVVVTTQSLPGGSFESYSEGDTLVHEVGHWLGLYHTFRGGCGPTGDYVDDTAAQADGVNVFSCDEALDTCSAPGTDPVHNYMSYGSDACLDRFTAGQDERMVQEWLAYREGR